MQATILGTGSALPSSERLQTGVLLADGETRLLVDCGSGVVHRLAQNGVDVREIDAILLTHHHLDHVADLPTLAKARVLQDHAPLCIAGPPATSAVCDHLFAVDDLDERLDLNVTEHTPDDGPLEVAGFEIELAETTHSKQCFAYRFGDALAISGDTEPTATVMDLADGVDTLIHECAYPDGVDSAGHSTPTELADHLEGIDVDRVYLTHLFPTAEAEAETIRDTVAARVDAQVRIASDCETVVFD
jgi:ribonuclease BN (tRNA processing enzyme)